MATTQQSPQNIDQTHENNQQNPSTNNENEENINDTIDQEEILSLCDLPIHTINHDHNHDDQEYANPNVLHQNSSSYVDNQDNFFEFFSEEWNITTVTSAATATTAASTNVATTSATTTGPTTTNFSKSNVVVSPKVTPTQQTLDQKIKKSTPQESQEKKGSLIPWKPNSIFSKSMKDSKFFLLVLFGVPPKIPTDEAELKTDMKNRLSRRAPFTFTPDGGRGSDCGGDPEVTAAVTRRRKRENVLWKFIKAATCFGGQPKENDVV